LTTREGSDHFADHRGLTLGRKMHSFALPDALGLLKT